MSEQAKADVGARVLVAFLRVCLLGMFAMVAALF